MQALRGENIGAKLRIDHLCTMTLDVKLLSATDDADSRVPPGAV